MKKSYSDRFPPNTRVILISPEYGDTPENPVWGGKSGYVVGTVTEIFWKPGYHTVWVHWDNNRSETYHKGLSTVTETHRIQAWKAGVTV